ncbi:TldD/PmbA family protein [Geoglobus acetivorans]|uniref:TldE protein, part of TldE/TldD proteolytic complex n=1 Tax=Geoglobus acetivorans TaxID=565033 RepID=A0A0A7GJE8_GEOAI|nr:TldE protein, part of TldE/TldD proteolytic complex [Geoglobus acetivorans]
MDGWEIYTERTISKYAVIENSKIKEIGEKTSKGEAFRAIVDGKVAMVSGSKIDDRMKELAVKLARNSQEELKEFPEKEKLPKVEIYDREVEKISPDEIRDLCEAISAVGNISYAQIEFEVTERRLTNSSGVEYSEKESAVGIVVEAVFNGGSAYEYHSSRRLDFRPEDFAERALELARMDGQRVKLESGKYTVTLSPIAVDQLLSHALYPAFYHENVKKGRSLLADKIDKNVFGELTVKDDPLIPYGMGSCSFDDEGVPAKSKTLVMNGVLKGFISDLKNSPENPTGNGFRDDYSAYPSTSPSNIILEYGDRGEAEGIYVHSFIGAHTANFVSGDFSLELGNAYYEGRAVKGAMIYGNIYDLLSRISHFGKDQRQVGVTLTPEIVFEGVEVKL